MTMRMGEDGGDSGEGGQNGEDEGGGLGGVMASTAIASMEVRRRANGDDDEKHGNEEATA